MRQKGSRVRKVGYRGATIVLRSPSGIEERFSFPLFPGVRGEKNRDRVSRLLSRGWKIVRRNGLVVLDNESESFDVDADTDKAGVDDKKNTDQVIGTTKTGRASHGGNHASKEVKDSPNPAKDGERIRGCRGGEMARKEMRDKIRRNSMRPSSQPVRARRCGGGNPIFSPEPIAQMGREYLATARRSGDLLAKVAGRSSKKTVYSTGVDVDGLLMALEIGENPIPYLEKPVERSNIKVLITPDCSGSTQGWNGVAQGWAQVLASHENLDVIYVQNSNGWLIADLGDKETKNLVQSVDLLVYLGDCDGRELCERYASYGTTVIALDSFCARVAEPRRRDKKNEKILWYDRCSAKEPSTWETALRMALVEVEGR